MLKHISWNYASHSQNYKHKSITSHPIPQTSYFQVKMKLYTQNHSLLLKNQTLPSDRTHKPSKSHTLQHSLRHWCNKFKTTFPKLVSYVACGSPHHKPFHMMNTKDTTSGYIGTFLFIHRKHTHTKIYFFSCFTLLLFLLFFFYSLH